MGLAIEAALRAQSYSLIVSFSGNSHEGEVRALELLSSKYVDGILLASVGTTTDAINELLKEEMPLVVFDNEPPQVATNVVLHDNINGAYVLTRHLIDHNYRSIGCVAGLQHQSSGSERLEGFLKAMEDNRLEAPASHIIGEDWTSEGVPGDEPIARSAEKRTSPGRVHLKLDHGPRVLQGAHSGQGEDSRRDGAGQF